MSNYEYIVASLPAISLEWKFGEGDSFGSLVSQIKSLLDKADRKTVDRLLDGYKEECMTAEFYEDCLKHPNPFIRKFFAFDLHVRNAKARFLNKAFGRPEEQDTIRIPVTGEFAWEARLSDSLAKTDLLERERSMDALMWDAIGEMTRFNYLDLDVILGFIARLHIVARWLELDEQAGREMFVSLVDEVRSTFKGVEYVAPQE